jgi:hypothetical protein
LRALALLAPLALSMLVFFSSLFRVVFMPYGSAAISGFGLLALWTITAVDGIRLNEPWADEFSIKHTWLIVALPLAAAAAGTFAQLFWEILIRPSEANFLIQGFFRWIFQALDIGRPSSVLPFVIMGITNVLLGWGGASAAVFAITAWSVGESRGRTALAAFAGFIAGMLFWSLTGLSVGWRPGSAFLRPR